jgi:hypothetical protein
MSLGAPRVPTGKPDAQDGPLWPGKTARDACPLARAGRRSCCKRGVEERGFSPRREATMAEKKNEGEKGSMTVKEAGQLGGQKGGQRERELVEKGHQIEEKRGGMGGEEPQGGSQKRQN